MPFSSFGWGALVLTTVACAIGAGGCSVSVTAKTQTKFVGSNALTASAAYDGKPIVVENANGNVTVVPGDGATVSASAHPFAFADGDKKADADAAIAEVQLLIDETSVPGSIHVQCTMAKGPHGSAGGGTTGCDGMTVNVPAGSTTAPITVNVTAHNGSAQASGLTGGVIVHSDNGNASLSVTPTKGVQDEASTGNGDAALTLPRDFAADRILISVPSTGKLTSAFADVTQATTSRGTPGTGASAIVLKSENGDLTLNAM